MATPRVSIQTADFDLGAEVAALRAADAGVGAVASFVGTVRDRHSADPGAAAVSAMDDDEAGARFFEALGPCMTDESAVTFLAGILSSQGQDEATAQCVAESVVGSAGAETMLGWFSEASTSGDSSELEEALSRGLLDCGVDTGDGSAPVESIPSIGGGISGN